jgi:hypothetical protein
LFGISEQSIHNRQDCFPEDHNRTLIAMASLQKLSWRAIQGVAGVLGCMYLVSGYIFITTRSIEFVHYTGVSAQEVWTIRNLGVRVLAIGIGLLLALLMRRKDALALMLLVRLCADVGDFTNSALTPGLDASVARTLAVFCVVELVALSGLVWILSAERKNAAATDGKAV